MVKKISYKKLIDMAQEYGVETNPLFIAAAAQYEKQRDIVEQMQAEVLSGAVMCEGEPHPLLKELPKHTDAANRSLNTMLDIVLKVGRQPKPAGTLQSFIDE